MNRAAARLTAAIRADLRHDGASRRAGAVETIDAWLTELWSAAVEAAAVDPAGVALAAVGSHARRDSGPASDLDLVLLHDDSVPAPALAELADQLWYPMWDEGFRVDHAVRTPSACSSAARRDLAVATGLLELRPIAGDASLAEQVRGRIRQEWRNDARRRLPDIVTAVAQDTGSRGDLADLLEPDLKHARGGLRDAVMIDALAATWLVEPPRDWPPARHRLLDVRDALHAVSGRSAERLALAEQDAVAAALGYADADDLLTDVSTCGRRIAHALDRTLRAANRAVSQRRGLRRPVKPRLTPVEPGLAVHEGEVVTLGGTTAVADPVLPLRAAATAARLGLPLSPATAATLGRVAATHPLPSPWPDAARACFVDLLASGPALPRLWEDLDHAGMITAWMAPWDKVRGRPQRNAVHRYTVDRHLVETCVQATRLRGSVERPDLLLLAALWHDIGKRAGERDHAAAGAPVAAALAAGCGLGPPDVAVVRRLVAEHLTLVDLATRRDPDDPRTVQTLATAVDHDPGVLDLLRALTEADARAAGPAAWTRWRQRLVDDLVERTKAVLAGRSAPAPGPLAAEELDLVEQVRRTGVPAVAVGDLADANVVTVVAPDRPGLFADVAGILAAQGIQVRTAPIRTVDGVAVDSWWTSGHRSVEPAVILTALERLTRGDVTVLDRLARREAAWRPPGGLTDTAQVLLMPGASQHASVVEVRALDRPGLLHRLGTSLREARVDIRSAHVATLAGRAVDVLYLAEGRGDAAGAVLSPARTAEVIGLLGAAAGAD